MRVSTASRLPHVKTPPASARRIIQCAAHESQAGLESVPAS